MESAVANLCAPGSRVLVVSAGAFGERWIEIAERYGCEVVPLRYEWGEIPQAGDIAAQLAELSEVRAVFLTHSETSTGVVSDLQAHAEAIRPSGAHVVVDAVSSLGAVPLEMDAWGVDVVCSGSQKALMTPPGLAVAAVSDAVWEPEGRLSSPRYYFDWERTRKAQDVLDAPFTPAVSLVAGLNVALGLMLEEGLEAVFDRHVRLGRACRAGAKALGLELFSPDDDTSAVVTADQVAAGRGCGRARLLAARAVRRTAREGARPARAAPSFASATSATTTSSTWRRRWPPSSWAWPSSAPRSSRAPVSRTPWLRSRAPKSAGCRQLN